MGATNREFVLKCEFKGITIHVKPVSTQLMKGALTGDSQVVSNLDITKELDDMYE